MHKICADKEQIDFIFAQRRIIYINLNANLKTNYMRIIVYLIIIIAFYSCSDQEKIVLSPKEKIHLLPYSDFITTTSSTDTISELNSFTELNNLWAVGAQNGIYLIDKNTKRVNKYYKFDIKKHHNLFDDQDGAVMFLSTNLVANKKKDKLLVITSNGIVFQINLKTYEIDWLTKFIRRIETATYSDDGKVIAIGTRYDTKENSKEKKEYYSSLFLINGKTGEYVKHFTENASIKKILFKDNDKNLLVAYDWNYTDSYLWDIDKIDESIAQFREEDSFIHDLAIISKNEFVTINTNGISLWNTVNHKTKSLIFPRNNSGYERILKNRINNEYVLIAYSNILFFDKNIHLKDSVQLPIKFENADYLPNDSIICLQNLQNNNHPDENKDDGKQGFYSFNLLTKKLTLTVDREKLNGIIKVNSKK